MNHFIFRKVSLTCCSVLLAIIVLITLLFPSFSTFAAPGQNRSTETGHIKSDFGTLFDTSNEFVVIKHKQMGGSHYAYTEAVSDETSAIMGTESNFDAGSEMVLLTLEEVNGQIIRNEELLLDSPTGVIRDPDVSEDGTTVLFSWKQRRNDDYHLYEMNLATKEYWQLTQGLGTADIEPKYLPSGKIIFSSTRCIEYVDCWITPVSNLYICDRDGSNIMRVGYDQVHTTYPTVTADGRILYTRWDYNDRTQMYIQGVFQMFQDGTNQTEVYGNNSNFPTTLLHTREVPGKPGLYVSISSGHHTQQGGKLVLVDTNLGRNEKDAVTFVFPDRYSSKKENEDLQNQSGPQYKYPVAISETEFLVSYAGSGWRQGDVKRTRFGIYYMNSKTGKKILLSDGTTEYGASQIAVIRTRKMFERPSTVDYGKETGTYYMANVYDGEGMPGVAPGTAKYLRVVALEFRSAAMGATVGNGFGSSDQFSPVATGNGSWDVKRVLGMAEIEEDGSAMFQVPAQTPVFFQVLNADGELIQSMRSWSTLMPNEVFSCVGCHEDKNTIPPVNSGVTKAMQKGVQTLKPDLWMKTEDANTYNPAQNSDGFSYLKEVQSILDESCISCHNNKDIALQETGAVLAEEEIQPHRVLSPIFREGGRDWKYTTEDVAENWFSEDYDDSSWKQGQAPFGTINQKTPWKTDQIFTRTTFQVENADALKDLEIFIKIFYDENPVVYLNGVEIYRETGYLSDYTEQFITRAFLAQVRTGTNTLAVSAENTAGGQCIDLGFYSAPKNNSNTANNPVSLESTPVLGAREKMYYTLSYLVLTGSKNKGNQFQGNPENKYTNWISAMSQPEILAPYQYGSTQSAIITRLKSGHGNLSKKQIQTFAAWIDLAVPFRGEYDEANNWNEKEYKEYIEKWNKRAYYDTADLVTKQIAAGQRSEQALTIQYIDDNGTEAGSVTASGNVQLRLDQKLSPGGTVKVTLPEGVKYFFLNLHPNLSSALIYCPNGVYEYRIPSFARSIFPSGFTSLAAPAITARIASEEELSTERNLALNPYDLKENTASFPHASASNVYNNDQSPEFSARNAIDGFKINNGHGPYPLQSWGPDLDPTDLWYQIDFGKEVYVNKVAITLRADFPHDTNFSKAVLEFSDGSVQTVELSKTAETQTFYIDRGTKATSFVKLKSFEKAGSEWAALTEVEVLGTVREVVPPVLENMQISGDAVLSPSFAQEVYEYTLSVPKDAETLQMSIKAVHASSIQIKINGSDVPYFENTGISIDPSTVTDVAIVLSGPGGNTVYTLRLSPPSALWWILLAAGGTAAALVIAALLLRKRRRNSSVSETSSELHPPSDTGSQSENAENISE